MRGLYTTDKPYGFLQRFWLGHMDVSGVPRNIRLQLAVLFCLLFLGGQILIAAIVWFLGLVVPLQPWSSLFFDCMVVLLAMGGAVVLLQPSLRHRSVQKQWQIEDIRVQGVLVLLLPVVECGTIVGELLTLQLPGYAWEDILPLFWFFFFFVLMQILLAGLGGSLLRAEASR